MKKLLGVFGYFERLASHAILSNFFDKQSTQNHPQYFLGLSHAIFLTTFHEIALYTSVPN